MLKSKQNPGYVRLRGELLSYRIELKRAAERAERSEDDTPPWLDEAMDLLDQAEAALEKKQIEEGWSYLNAARRVQLDSLGSDKGDRIEERKNALGVQAEVILADANTLLNPGVRHTIIPLIADKLGQVKSDLTVAEVREARYILDREHQLTHLRRRYVQEQLQGLTIVGVVSLTLFVLLTLAGGYVAGGPISPFDAVASQQSWFIVYVLLAGTIGASLFGIISSIGVDPRAPLPQTISSNMMVIARVLIGTISAFVLYIFIRSDFVSLDGISEAGILLIALAAGYSERLAPKALNHVSDRFGSQIERDEELLSRLDTLSTEMKKTTESKEENTPRDRSDSR